MSPCRYQNQPLTTLHAHTNFAERACSKLHIDRPEQLFRLLLHGIRFDTQPCNQSRDVHGGALSGGIQLTNTPLARSQGQIPLGTYTNKIKFIYCPNRNHKRKPPAAQRLKMVHGGQPPAIDGWVAQVHIGSAHHIVLITFICTA